MNLSLVIRLLVLSPTIVLGSAFGQSLTEPTRPLGEWRLDPAHSDSLRARTGQGARPEEPLPGPALLGGMVGDMGMGVAWMRRQGHVCGRPWSCCATRLR